ncbi:AAA domain-containing protein [Ureaplasma urealyticum]|uniref:AAA domain-containing protein n=1 Tax=Ureaplasma urealyticum TaxID=2130 RepID=UPI002100426F|nr:AAA domain-containing protein [Ureaplasma urealyticum]
MWTIIFLLNGYLYYQNENDLYFDIDNKFQEFEANQKNILKDLFEDLSDNDLINNADIEMKFNDAIKTYLQKNTNGKISIDSPDCCAYKIVNNLKNECNYLHSFFVKDLKKAIKIDLNECKNLKAYLDSEQTFKTRINLDSEIKSFNNIAYFQKILMPNQFPLGRFLNKSEYPLSLMQQIAVNKLTKMEEENLSIQSVNGPPGTGKTTLLQDVVAELIVKQAYEICYLEKRVFDDENIDQLNRSITKNSVMVVSSNNGAVQNIVNEWIQTNKIETKAFIEKLLEIDYFSEIANEGDILKNEFLGLLSCEGGKRTNVNKMLEKLEHIVDNLNKATDHKNVYQDFKDAYEELKN